jgi:hypothetical protein
MPKPTAKAQLNRYPGRALLMGAAMLLLTPAICRAQENNRPDPLSWYIDGGGGWTAPLGTEANSLTHSWKNFEAGVAFLPCSTKSKRFFLGVNFLFDQLAAKEQALLAAQALNPTDIGLLQATGAKATYLSATLEPTYRVAAGDRVTVYFFGGFGWFRRSLEFTGNSNAGALLQPGGPAVFGSGGDSGAFDAGAGTDFRPSKGRFTVYLEFRYLHGLALNHETTLIPLSAGFRW